MATIQIRDLPEEAVRTFKVRAAEEGKSLQQYMRGLLADIASKPTMAEVIARIEREDEGFSSPTDTTALLREVRREREDELERRFTGSSPDS